MIRALVVCLALVGGLSCSGDSEDSLLVFGAASLEDVLVEAAATWSESSQVVVRFNFAGSNELTRQILAGAHADVIFSAGEEEVSRLLQANLVEPDTISHFLTNRMVLVTQRSTPSKLPLREPEPRPALAIAEDSVPAGRYGRKWLTARGYWNEFGGESAVISTLDVRAALAAVESGAVPFGCVYSSDARMSNEVLVLEEQAAGELPDITYPVAVLRESRLPEQARDFVTFLSDHPELFERYGFSTRR